MSASRRATIADVAAASGVGVGTVSRVINGAANVRDATRASVLKVIEQLGYRPSHLAASLSRGTPRAVAIVVPQLTRPSAVMRLAGALAVLDEQGYDTVVCNVDTPQQRDHHLAALTGRHRADGVIVVSLRLSRTQLASFRHAGVPLVTIDAPASGVPQTLTDDVAGGRLATGHLLALGHRRIGFVGDTMRGAAGASRLGLGFIASQHRLSGYRQALSAAGIGYDARLVRRGPHGPANAEALAAELLARPDRPSAIFAASDTQAMGVLAAADRCGVSVPGELSVIGLRRHRVGGAARPEHGPAAAGGQRRRGGAPAVRAAARGAGQPAAAAARPGGRAALQHGHLPGGPGRAPPSAGTVAGAAAVPAAARPSFALPGSTTMRPSFAAAGPGSTASRRPGVIMCLTGKLRWLRSSWNGG